MGKQITYGDIKNFVEIESNSGCKLLSEKYGGAGRGGDRKSNSHNGSLKLSQSEIAQQLNISVTELNRMLEIERKLTPEIKDLLDTGIISKTSASKIWTKLSETEQDELLQELGKDKIKAMTIKETEQYIEGMQKIEREKQEISERYNNLVTKNQQKQKDYNEKINKLQANLNKERMKKVEVVTEEVDNTDYTRIEKLEKELAKTLKEKNDYYSKYSSTLENLKVHIQIYYFNVNVEINLKKDIIILKIIIKENVMYAVLKE